MNKPFIKLTLLISITSFLITGCGSTQQEVKAPIENKVPPPTIRVAEEITLTPDMMIQRAEQAWQQSRDTALRTDWLLSAAESYLALRDTPKARQITYSLREDLSDGEQQARFNLLIAKIYFDDPSVGSQERLALLTPLAADNSIKGQQYRQMAIEYAKLGEWLAAANALLKSDTQNVEHVRQAWEWVNKPNAILPSTNAHFELLSAYLSLRELILDYGFNHQELVTQIDHFKTVYRGHPLVEHWPESLYSITQVSVNESNHVVVLLPLSGRLATTGAAIKEGILAAYFNDANAMNATELPLLRFVDSNNKSAEELLLETNQADWIIGPLLKENVEGLLPLLEANQHILTLNRPGAKQVPLADNLQQENTPSLYSTQIYFSLAPEDEAEQLAQQVFVQGKRVPIVVASSNSLHQRMQTAFLKEWKALTAGLGNHQHTQPALVTYSDNSTLSDGILNALDVAQSKTRIREIQSFADTELYNLPRNRRDIDAIIVFTTPQQTALVNPVIEASIVPFNGVKVPVFATSRSVDYAQTSSQWRDLENLHFIDMPWVLPNESVSPMAMQVQALWPQRSTTLQRLFAFGVDAYQLIPFLGSMVNLPQLHYDGLTGTLQINNDKEVVRKLSNAIVNNQQVNLAID